MSNILKTRQLIAVSMERNVQRRRELEEDYAVLEEAYQQTFRDTAIRRAPGKSVPITKPMRDEVHRLARTTSMTMQQIADKVGLRNGGRVSEILNGKRDEEVERWEEVARTSRLDLR